jgi:hypothetical protein
MELSHELTLSFAQRVIMKMSMRCRSRFSQIESGRQGGFADTAAQ